MLQRKQTLYMLLAVVFVVVCLCLNLAVFEQKGMGLPAYLSNFCFSDGNGERSFGVCANALLLLFAVYNMVRGIFSYKNRPKQISYCLVTIVDMVVWYVFLVWHVYSHLDEGMTFTINWPAVLPLLVALCSWLAYRGVKADEALVRAADRIR